MADILIRGMAMPKTCVQCDLKRYDQERIWTDNGTELLGAWVCKRTDEIIWNTQRGENCPLASFPERHGRLIDANELELDLVRHNGAIGFELIGNAPTIVPSEGGGDDG